MRFLEAVLALLLVPVAISLLSQGCLEVCPAAARLAVRLAARCVQKAHRRRYRDEWLAELDALGDKPVLSLVVALRILLLAPTMRVALRGGLPRGTTAPTGSIVTGSRPSARHGSTGGPLRIGVVAPPWFELPPRGYGGVEAIVFHLVQGLVARGHDVTLVGVGQDRTYTRFLPTYAQPLAERIGQTIPEVVHALTASEYLDQLRVDVIHDHTMIGPLLLRGGRVPAVVTAHGPISDDLARYYRMISRFAGLVAVSESQRATAPHLPWAGTVHNAIPVNEYPFQADKDDYVLFLGRASPEKAPHLAIEAARAAGRRIILAAKCHESEEQRYFEERIRPLLGPGVEWMGEARSEEKKDLLARARCLVFPIQWEEPFGIVMVEAMACGTPVVALRRGSVPEVVADGVTGWICNHPDELAAAIERTSDIDPSACRARVADQFDVPDMVRGYEAIFREALESPAERAPVLA